MFKIRGAEKSLTHFLKFGQMIKRKKIFFLNSFPWSGGEFFQHPLVKKSFSVDNSLLTFFIFLKQIISDFINFKVICKYFDFLILLQNVFFFYSRHSLLRYLKKSSSFFMEDKMKQQFFKLLKIKKNLKLTKKTGNDGIIQSCVYCPLKRNVF